MEVRKTFWDAVLSTWISLCGYKLVYHKKRWSSCYWLEDRQGKKISLPSPNDLALPHLLTNASEILQVLKPFLQSSVVDGLNAYRKSFGVDLSASTCEEWLKTYNTFSKRDKYFAFFKTNQLSFDIINLYCLHSGPEDIHLDRLECVQDRMVVNNKKFLTTAITSPAITTEEFYRVDDIIRVDDLDWMPSRGWRGWASEAHPYQFPSLCLPDEEEND